MPELTVKERVWGDLCNRYLVTGSAGAFVTATNGAHVLSEAAKYVQDACEARTRATNNLGDITCLRECAKAAKDANEALEQCVKWADHWKLDLVWEITLWDALRNLHVATQRCASVTREQFMRATAREAGL